MSARASCAFDLPSRCCRHDGVACVSNLSRSHLGVCLRRRRSLLASLGVATAPQITSASLSFLCRRLAPPAPSTFICVVRHHDGIACVWHLLRFSSLRAPRAPSVFARGTRRCAGILSHPHVSRARVMSARASCAFDLPSRHCRHDGVACISNLSRSDLGVCLRRCRSSLASLVVATAPQITRASLSFLCRRRAPPAPSTFPRVAGATMALLAFRISRVPISACAPSVFARVACRRNGAPNHSRDTLLRAVGACLLRRRSFLSSLVATTALLAFRISRVHTSTCASGALCLRSRCLSSRRRPKSLTRLSRSRVVGARLLSR